jgi:hypothetical protein
MILPHGDSFIVKQTGGTLNVYILSVKIKRLLLSAVVLTIGAGVAQSV